VKVGDLVKFEPEDSGDGRQMGIILGFDVYHSHETLRPLRQPEAIVKVLWNTTKIGWVLKGRVEAICGK